MQNDNLLVSLKRWASQQDENFTTEAFAYLLCYIRDHHPNAAAKLPPVTVPPAPRQFSDERRRQEILDEIAASGAELLILLGDQPIRWFLRFYDDRWRRLADFGATTETYGRRHSVELAGRAIEVLPLAHPRQAGRLGQASKRWYDLHREWEKAGGHFQPTSAAC